jgi:hypothetical protein
MINAIFQVDWVFIDTVIIFLLLLLLLSVKLFKITYRWRLSFSNVNLESHYFPQIPENLKSHYIKAINWTITKNSLTRKQKIKTPLILISRTNLKRRLIKILTEGLSSYGFTIINARIKIKHNSKIGNEIIENEIESYISSAFGKFEKEGLINSLDHLTISYSKSLVPPTAFLSEPDNFGLILINPKINKASIGRFKEIKINLKQFSRSFYIFSKRNFFILKNRNLKRFIKEFGYDDTSVTKVTTLERSNRNFKYYETVLLGTIINLIENEIIDSKTND